MKKIDRRFLLILFQLFIITYGCKTVSKTPKLFITISGSVEYPVDIVLGDFFSNVVRLNLIDTSDSKINYNFVPGEMLSINKDTSIYLFYSDSITVDYRPEKPIFYSANAENTKYNRFYNELSSALSPIYQTYPAFFLDKKDSIVRNENYIDNHLSKSDSLILQQVNTLCNKYQFPQSTRSEIIRNVLETEELALSYSYLDNCIPELDSSGTLQTRLQHYVDKINQQHVSIFSQKNIALLIGQIAYHLIQMPIRRIKSRDQLKSYYSDVQHFFTKGSICYNYLASSLEVQAKKSNIELRGSALKALKQDARESIFKKYVEGKYNHETKDLKDSPLNMSLYDTRFSSTDLSNVISQFENKPLLIDFWASWCLPCLKKILETIDYKKKYSNLNIIFISLDKSQDVWKLYLYEHNLMKFIQYRRNFNNQDSLFNRIQGIPKYGLLDKDGHIELFDEISDSLMKSYYEKF